MNYADTITYLYEKLPMFSRMGSAAFKKDLTNIRALCTHLGDPHLKFRSIHVGGTNGKGSVSHMLSSVLQEAGYRTGLYTSPHLYDFRERIRIDGEMVPENFVIEFVAETRHLIEEIEPSFFEITVAMAFAHFARQQVDIAVIEVGLGGRLDSTNLITPELSVITNIGWDHMQFLGNTLAEIAEEKAGIIKRGVPVVIGERAPETDPVFEKIALHNHAPLYFAGDTWRTVSMEWEEGLLHLQLQHPDEQNAESYVLDLPGIYQSKNICTVRCAVDRLNENAYGLSGTHIRNGLRHAAKKTGLYGRWETIRREPRVILEVAHNKNGVASMLQHLEHQSFQRLHILIGMVKDKEVETVLQLLPKDALYYFTQAGIPRALPASELMQKAEAFGLKGEKFDSVNEALEEALRLAGSEDLLLVCGSIFLVAEVDKVRFGNEALHLKL